MLQESQFAQSKWVERGMQETLGKTNVSQHFSRRSKWKTFIGSLTHASRGGRHGHQGHPPQIQLQPLRNLWFFRQEYRGWPDMHVNQFKFFGRLHLHLRFGGSKGCTPASQSLVMRSGKHRRWREELMRAHRAKRGPPELFKSGTSSRPRQLFS